MTRYILILLINVIGIFAANARCHANHGSIISKYDHHENTCGEIESTQISVVSSAIMEVNDIRTDHCTTGNKYLHSGNYSKNRHSKSDFKTDNTNLRSFIQKDIHFLSVLLI